MHCTLLYRMQSKLENNLAVLKNVIENGNSLRRTPIDGRRSELQANNQISLNNRQANVLNDNAYGAEPYENLNVA